MQEAVSTRHVSTSARDRYQYDIIRSSIRMALRRVADTPTPSRRRQVRPALELPPGEPSEPARDLLLRSWPGRLFLVAFAVKLLVAFVRLFVEPPAYLLVLSTTATVALLVALTYFLARLVLLVKRRLLWRV